MWTVKTSVDPETGVVGLNGDFYLLDENDEPIHFESREDAWEFMEDNHIFGGDDEYLDYVEVDDDRGAL